MSSKATNYLYREAVPAGKMMKALFAGAILLFLAISLVNLWQRGTEWEEVAASSALAFFLVGLTYWNFRRIEIWVTPEDFRARYGVFNQRRILLSDILSTEVTTASFGPYWGMSVRCGWDGTWAYTTSFGPALRLNRRQGRPFVVSTNQPQALAQAIRGLSAGRQQAF